MKRIPFESGRASESNGYAGCKYQAGIPLFTAFEIRQIRQAHYNVGSVQNEPDVIRHPNLRPAAGRLFLWKTG